jgi:hypothetical protein
MSNFEWSKRSKAVLITLHPDLQKIMNLAIQRTNVDVILVEGARNIATQRRYYKDGLSMINPDKYDSEEALCKVAKHITITEHPLYEYSRALDFCAYAFHKGKNLSYDLTHLIYLSTVVEQCAKDLHSRGVIDHLIRTGINWDGDSILMVDQSFNDAPHVELIKP